MYALLRALPIAVGILLGGCAGSPSPYPAARPGAERSVPASNELPRATAAGGNYDVTPQATTR
jgi:hypothetical protein